MRTAFNACDGVFSQLGAFGAERDGPESKLHARGRIAAGTVARADATDAELLDACQSASLTALIDRLPP